MDATNRARAMDAIFFMLRTGCQWNALRATDSCSSSAAHRRFQEWTQAGVFEQLWTLGLQVYEELKEIHGQVRRNGCVPHVIPRDAERQLLAKIPGYRARRLWALWPGR